MLGTRIARQPLAPALLGLAALLGSCQSTTQEAVLDEYTLELAPGQLGLVQLPDGADWPDFSIGWPIREHMVDATDASLAYLSKPSSKGFFPYGPISHDRMVRSLERFRELLESSPSSEVFLSGLRDEFEVWVARGGSNAGDVLFTGYGTPIYKGSRTRTGVYQYPLYKLPDDLVKAENGDILGCRTASGNIVPYYTHRELIDGGHLDGQELV